MGHLARHGAVLALGLSVLLSFLAWVACGRAPEASFSANSISGAALAGSGRIAFTSRRDFNWEIYVMNADGTGPTRLTNHLARDESPAWSPDGTTLAFTSAR